MLGKIKTSPNSASRGLKLHIFDTNRHRYHLVTIQGTCCPLTCRSTAMACRCARVKGHAAAARATTRTVEERTIFRRAIAVRLDLFARLALVRCTVPSVVPTRHRLHCGILQSYYEDHADQFTAYRTDSVRRYALLRRTTCGDRYPQCWLRHRCGPIRVFRISHSEISFGDSGYPSTVPYLSDLIKSSDIDSISDHRIQSQQPKEISGLGQKIVAAQKLSSVDALNRNGPPSENPARPRLVAPKLVPPEAVPKMIPRD